MKKIIAVSLCVTALAVTTQSMALNWPWKNKTADSKKEAATQPQTAADTSAKAADNAVAKSVNKKADALVKLFNAPTADAKVVKKLPVDTNLVAIFRKGEWVKVGDRQDGTTGWINIKQYHQAKQDYYRAYFHEKTETVYFHSEKGKDGKTSIVAYRNGKKLSDADAKKMYQHLQHQEQQQWHEMERFNKIMNFPFMMMPGIVVIEHQPAEAKKVEAKPADKK